MRVLAPAVCAAALAVTVLPQPAAAAEQKIYVGNAMAMHGKAKYGADFTHFDYVNPDAAKGGKVKFFGFRTFDNLNRFIIKGLAARGITLIEDSLMITALDEPFTMYGLVAETIEVPEDRSWVVFNLRPEARFHDGKPMTADDVIFTFNVLLEKGQPFYRAYYGSVAKVEKLGPRKVKFTFKPTENRELPLILGQLAVLPKHYWEGRKFDKTTLEPPLGSGPYKIKSLDPGHSITYERVKDYWAKDLPVNRGRYNFDLVRYDYYLDMTVTREALKAGEFDFMAEGESKAWATAYDVSPVKAGLLIKKKIDHQRSTGMQSFAFNLRRPMFKNRMVRQALAHAFDFEWSNKNLFFGQYARTASFYSNSELASSGLPKGEELEILERFRGRIPDEVFTKEYKPPAYDGSGSIRSGQRAALRLLKQAGWVIVKRKLVDAKTGKQMRFEILFVSPAFERVILPFVRNLKKLGIDARARLVDPSQYQNRLDQFDFDMIIATWGQSLSPGNEQREFWSSKAAKLVGSRNFVGIQDPAIDELIELLIQARTRESLVARVRALDRVLLWHHFVIPQWHLSYDRLVFWDKFGLPKVTATLGTTPFLWWIDTAKVAALAAKRSGAKVN